MQQKSRRGDFPEQIFSASPAAGCFVFPAARFRGNHPGISPLFVAFAEGEGRTLTVCFVGAALAEFPALLRFGFAGGAGGGVGSVGVLGAFAEEFALGGGRG